jgi:prepilin-type processing-associated H-X9-DG protein
MASDFSYTNADGGFFVPGFRNAALSYIIGLHSFPDASRAILSGDRNIRWDGLDQLCSAGIRSCATIFGGSNPSAAAWINAIHGEGGNLLFNDGRVAEVSNAGLRQASKPAQDDISYDHFLVPN